MLSTINELIPGISQHSETIRGEIQMDKIRSELTQQLDVMRADILHVRYELDPLRMDIVRLKTICQQNTQNAQPGEPTWAPSSWNQAPPGNSANRGANEAPPNFGTAPTAPRQPQTGQAPPHFGATPTAPQQPQTGQEEGAKPNLNAGLPQPDFGQSTEPGPSGAIPKSPPQPSAKQPEFFNIGSP